MCVCCLGQPLSHEHPSAEGRVIGVGTKHLLAGSTAEGLDVRTTTETSPGHNLRQLITIEVRSRNGDSSSK